MFDLTPLTAYQYIIFLSVFLFVFLALWSVVFVFKPASHKVPAEKAVNRKRDVYYAGSYLVIFIVLATVAVLIKEASLVMGLVIGAALILLIGSSDEKNNLSPGRQFIWQVLIAATIVYFGWTIPHVSNPLGGGVLDLSLWTFGNWVFPGSIIAILWLVFVMNAFNWLDGVDGLAGSVALMVFLTLAVISLLPMTQDSRTLSLSLIGGGAILAFLVWNFAPAHVYLGTTGSWFIGLFIGLVAIIGGGKIATALLVMAIPILDTFLVVGQRLLEGKAPWHGDKEKHLHFRLLEYGLSSRAVSVIAGLTTALLGVMAVFMQTNQKIGLLFVVGLGMIILTIILYRHSMHRRSI